MSFTSHAQNFEDVMLWRALRHVEHGAYVDVGAQHPVIDSVSKAFHQQGWRGLHIEPVHEYAELLRQDRPDDMVLEVALAEKEGSLALQVIPGTGLSTAVEANARRHAAQDGLTPEIRQVPAITLDAAVAPLRDQPVHWLKIDVEGLEESVLKGWDSGAFRPWIIVVEATLPSAQTQSHAAWEPLLLAADYSFVYFDGLNRFYLAREHQELAESFTAPPNVFDDILLTEHSPKTRQLVATHWAERTELLEQVRACQNAARATEALGESRRVLFQQHLDLTQRALADTQQALSHSQATLALTEQALADIQASRFWRLTAPLRGATDQLRRLRGQPAAPSWQRLKPSTPAPGAPAVATRAPDTLVPILDAPPSFKTPTSQACTQAQFDTPEFLYWCERIGEQKVYQRKLWEYCYLLQVLASEGMIAPGRRGLGFGVGKEMTVALLAAHGVEVTATDLHAEAAQEEWVETGQHAASLRDLNDRNLCPPEQFERLVQFRAEDMTAISPDLVGYDFVWSLCAFEHLGSLAAGLDFVRNTLGCVNPGGLLVHTTELNCRSDGKTLDSGSIVIYRRGDFIRLAEQLGAEGHQVRPLNFNLGEDELDCYVDQEPYNMRRHLRLRLGGHVTTSFGLIIRKAANPSAPSA